MRLFVAVRPPAAVLGHLAQALDRGPAPTWHVTLAFLGEVEDDAPLAAPLAAAAAGRAPFRLALAGSGRFGRAVWVGVTGNVPALTRLAAEAGAACGLVQDRPYRPHLTVARGRLDPAVLASYAGPAWTVDRLVLVRSVLGQQAEHTVLQEHRLLGPLDTARPAEPGCCRQTAPGARRGSSGARSAPPGGGTTAGR